jgi:hypothetical protein
MTASNADDPWADLYKDLGLPGGDSPRPRAEPVEPAAEWTAEPEPELVEDTAVPAMGDEEGFGEEEGEEVEAVAEEGSGAQGEGEGEDPTKKRRRRRRRRKKKAGVAEGAVGETAIAEVDAEAEPEEPAVTETAEDDLAAGPESEFTPELTRDLIANWNVPSWSEIVAGLYRPDRG